MRLILVAGVSCAGKSHLVHREYGGLDFLEFDREEAFYFDDAEFARRPVEAEILILQYDLMRLYDEGIGSFEADILPVLFARSERIDVVTVRADAATLVRRCEARLRGLRRSFRLFYRPWHTLRRLRRLGEKIERYAEPAYVDDLYTRWFAFLTTVPAARHYLLEGVGHPPVSITPACGSTF